ncbi:MAG: hypothetical protein ACJA0S_000296 [Rickettsiales bacterium]|jgi:hypothetical protein
MFKISIILLILFPFSVQAEIQITNWDEKIILTKNGKESNVRIKARITDLAKNQYHNGFEISFDPRQKIKIKGVLIDNQKTKNSFQNNHLKISFPRKKSNNDELVINFAYIEKYGKIHQYLRSEIIRVPSFTSGAFAQVEVYYPWSLTSATLNKNIKEFNKKFVYKGIVPPKGISEIVKLTNSRNSWNVKIKNSIRATGKINSLEMSIPNYFSNSGQQKYGYQITSNPATKIKTNEGKSVLGFGNLENKNIFLQITSQIKTGNDNRSNIHRNPSDYLQISDSDKFLLSAMLKDISQDDDLKGFPLYAKIGVYVHNYIKYDLSYINKLPNLEKIIINKMGVCTEYAKLYNSLARTAGIPSLVVVGVAHGEYDGFEGHAWNLIHHNNRWIYVDPTWNLMSGTVSSSHIYFNDDGIESLSLKWKAVKGKGEIEIENQDKNFEIQKIW